MRKRQVVSLVLAIMLFLAGCSGKKPAAVINDEEISLEKYNRYVEHVKAYSEQGGASFEGEEGEKQLTALKEDAIDALIYETLIRQEAKKEKVSVTEKEVSDYLKERIKTSFADEEKYQAWLDAMKLTEEELKDQIEYQFIGGKLFDKVTEKIEISDEAVKAYYEKDKTPWEMIRVSHILVAAERDAVSQEELKKARDKAVSLIEQLDQGADFAQLAKKNSDDSGTAPEGGVLDMEFGKKEQGLVPEFVEGAFQLEQVGDYSKEPVLSQFGYHIIRLDEKKGSLASVKENVREELLQTEKNNTFRAFMDQAMEKAKITNHVTAEKK